MNYFAWAGVVFAGLIGLAVLAGAVGYLLDKWANFIDRFASRHADLVRRDTGSRILSYAWWFSEDKATFDLLCDIGNAFANAYGIDDWKFRERWRETRAIKPLEKVPAKPEQI